MVATPIAQVGAPLAVLPLLKAPMVPELMDSQTFLAGHGLEQAVSGPLFTLAAYLGQVVGGPFGALVATVFVLAAGFVLLVGVLVAVLASPLLDVLGT